MARPRRRRRARRRAPGRGARGTRRAPRPGARSRQLREDGVDLLDGAFMALLDRVLAALREERARLVDAAELDQAAGAQDVGHDPLPLELQRALELGLRLREAALVEAGAAEAVAGELVVGVLLGERLALRALAAVLRGHGATLTSPRGAPRCRPSCATPRATATVPMRARSSSRWRRGARRGSRAIPT